MATKNRKNQSQSKKFLNLNHIRRWGMVLIIWILVLPYSQWHIMNAYSNETPNLTHGTKIQTEAVKGSDDVIKTAENVTKRKAPLEIQIHMKYDMSMQLHAQADIIPGRRKQGKTKEAYVHKSNTNDHTQITLQFRNLSHHPTAVTDVYVRQGESILSDRGYKSRIKSPIPIKALRKNKVTFPLEEDDRKNMTDILIRDKEGNEYICTIEPRKCVNK